MDGKSKPRDHKSIPRWHCSFGGYVNVVVGTVSRLKTKEGDEVGFDISLPVVDLEVAGTLLEIEGNLAIDEEEEVELTEDQVVEISCEAEQDTRELIKDDDFIVPVDFHDFNERYPKYIGRFLYRKNCPRELIEDFSHDLVVHLLTVSKKSPYNDRIHAFQPDKVGGSNAGHFFFYLNMSLGRKYITLINKRKKEPSSAYLQVSFDPQFNLDHPEGQNAGGVRGVMTEYGLANHVMSCFKDSFYDSQVETNLLKREFVGGFRRYVKERGPSLLPFFDYFSKYESIPAIARATGLQPNQINKAKNQLRFLAGAYARGIKKSNFWKKFTS